MARVLLLLLLTLLFTSALIIFSIFPQAGTARRVRVMRRYGTGNSPVGLKEDESRLVGREMMESEMDYAEPRANTNPRNAPRFNTQTPLPPTPIHS